MSNKKERITQMLSLFNENEALSCKQLSELLNISEMTVRRDLSALQESNIIARGAKVGTFSLVSDTANTKEDYQLSVENVKFSAEKERIGKFAASFVSDGDAIIIDTGTTTSRMIRWIPDNISFSALCYNYKIFEELILKKKCDIILAGGQVNRATYSFNAEESLQTIRKFRANKYFIAASGIHEKLGITCGYRSELANKQEAIRSSLTTILLADASKFGAIRAAYFGELDDIDVIITDTNLSDEWKSIIKNKGIDLHLV